MAQSMINWTDEAVAILIEELRDSPISFNYSGMITKLALKFRTNPNNIHEEVLKRLEQI